MINKLSLLVCSNRENSPYLQIWKDVYKQNLLSKIILVTQEKANSYKERGLKILYIKTYDKGRSRAINRGLKKINTSLIGLTDDDCILDKRWATEGAKSIKKYSSDLVFGRTLAYKPKNNPNKICPCTFIKQPNKPSVTTQVCRHWIHVGFDNNAVIKSKVFDKIGGYKWWLGPGSIGEGADDAEFILRALVAKFKIAYNPSMVVYHNKWLTQQEWKQILRVYMCGGVAAYGFYAFQGVKECKPVLKEYVHNTINGVFRDTKACFEKPSLFKAPFNNILLELFYLAKGLLLAFIFAKLVPIPEKEDVVKKFYAKK